MTESARLLAEDEAARVRALDFDSFIVEAPAGAGKTELLTQRYLKLLATVESPEEIVAITFTNKAAGEMGSRILESLSLAARGERPDKPHKQITFGLAQAALAAGAARGWGLLDHPGRLRITTIDALCTGFARQMPLLSRFGSQPRVVDDASRHYAEASRRTLARMEDGDDFSARVAEALRHLDNDAVRMAELLTEMLARRDQWLRHALTPLSRAEAEAGFAQLIGRELERAAGAVDARRQGVLMATARYAADNVTDDSAIAALRGWTAPLAADMAAMPRWRGLCELLLKADGEARKAWNKNQGIPPGKEGKPYKDLLADFVAQLSRRDIAALARVRGLPEPRYSDEEWRAVEAMSALLAVAAADLWTVFNAAGEVDFIEVARRALLALGDAEAPTDLALALDYKIRHLLVDEFQDTSPTQVELLERLIAGWTPGDGRTLFAVGDPMQSIYRFRKADVGLFLRVAEGGVGDLQLESLRLTRNNRSAPAVVEWINSHFDSVFPNDDSVFDGAIRYREFAATREPEPGSSVFVHPLLVAKEVDDESVALIEAEKILEVIAAARRERPAASIAVLVRARRHLDALVAAARRTGLQFEAVEIERLAGRQPVQDLLSLTRALFHRADRVAWLAILRAPWCGLLLSDLFALAGDDHKATIWQLMQDEGRVARLSPSGQRRLLHLRGVIAEAMAHRGRQRPRRWIESTWLKLGGAACLAGPGDVADTRAYLDRVDRLDATGRFALDELEREMEKLYATPDATNGTLQFMTIHRAKGLEFDTVIVPGLHRATGGIDQKLMRWEEVAFEGTAERLVAAPIRRGKRGNGDASLHDYLRLLDAERGANEDVRALYVAATRAKRALHWVGVARSKDDAIAAPAAGSFLRLLWPALQAEFAQAALIEGDGAHDDDAAFVPKLVRLIEPATPAVLRVESAAPVVLPMAVKEEGDRLASDTGTLVHAYLEMIARDGLDAWPVERIDGLNDAMALWFGQQGHAAAQAKAGTGRAREALQVTLQSEDGRWVLAAREGAAAELALTSAEGLATQVLDRSFVEDGVRWIIDYKTMKVPPAASNQSGFADNDADSRRPIVGADATAKEHAERYREQLERYAEVFRADGLPIRIAVFYAAVGELVELASG
ncbi:MAG: UvrD-helicase domain-containing protein [Sulfurisoma sp.]|nr:UvrD-helicase domain-containing protein [Sulfurisoma sp.]